MSPPHPDPRAARVVAWHNRHPLARRITAAQVQGLGFVAVPFFAADGNDGAAAQRPAAIAAAAIEQAQASAAAADTTAADETGLSLRERAAARAKQAAGGAAEDAGGDADTAVLEAPPLASAAAAAPAFATSTPTSMPATGYTAPLPKPRGLRAAFVEDFIAPISRRAAARFIARHGVVLAAAPTDAPLREVAVAKAALPGDAVLLLYAQTAAIEVGARRVRVLMSPGADDADGAVLGPRLFDRRRIAAVCTVFVAAVTASAAIAAWTLRPAAVPHAPTAAAPVVAAGVAPAMAAVVVPAASAAREAPAQTAAQPASAAAAAPPTPPPATSQHDAEPEAAPAPALTRPDLRPALDDATKAAARQAVADLRATRPGPAPAPAPAPLEAPVPVPAPTPAPAVADGRPLFALSTRVLRTQAESEQLASAARALLAARAAPQQKVELMPAGADWRVVAWPFNSAAEAERARALLASRGLRVEVVAF